MEQVYASSREDFLTRLGEHPYVKIQNAGHTLILRKGWLQMISLSIIQMEQQIVVRFKPKISLIGLMILATIIVVSIATISWVWALLEVILIGFAMLVLMDNWLPSFFDWLTAP